jgi:cold-inducible RNA-binding protein
MFQDRTTGRSKGFGFVTFADKDSADQAIKAPGHEIDGRTVSTYVA